MIWNLHQTLMKGPRGAWCHGHICRYCDAGEFSSQCWSLKRFYYLTFPEIVFHNYFEDNVDIIQSVHCRRFIGNDKEAAYSCACMGAWMSRTHLQISWCRRMSWYICHACTVFSPAIASWWDCKLSVYLTYWNAVSCMHTIYALSLSTCTCSLGLKDVGRTCSG